MKTKLLGLIFVFLLVILTSACGPSPEEIATQTASAWTATPKPTNTPLPTATFTPTATSTPTSTPTPTPLALEDVFAINPDASVDQTDYLVTFTRVLVGNKSALTSHHPQLAGDEIIDFSLIPEYEGYENFAKVTAIIKNNMEVVLWFSVGESYIRVNGNTYRMGPNVVIYQDENWHNQNDIILDILPGEKASFEFWVGFDEPVQISDVNDLLINLFFFKGSPTDTIYPMLPAKLQFDLTEHAYTSAP